VDHLASLVPPNGLLLLAIYNETKHSRHWLTVKRIYNRSPRLLRSTMRALFHALVFGRLLMRRKNPMRYVQSRQRRGMSYFRNVEDWFGGLPYEYATPQAVIRHVGRKGFELAQLKTTPSHGCNEFLFRKLTDS
jgi:hypothetical protein